MKESESKLVRWAEEQLRDAGLFDSDSNYGGAMGQATLEIIKVAAKQEHSGASMMLVRQLLHRLLAWIPIVPIKDEPSEWVEVGPGVLQHKRCPGVFKEDGMAHYIDGKIFQDEPGGDWYTSRDSRVPIEKFPWLPPDGPEKIRW